MEDKNTINTNTANAQDTNDQSDVLLEIGKKFIEEHIELLKALANDDKE